MFLEGEDSLFHSRFLSANKLSFPRYSEFDGFHQSGVHFLGVIDPVMPQKWRGDGGILVYIAWKER